MLCRTVAVFALATFLCGCQTTPPEKNLVSEEVRAALSAPSSVELLSLDPVADHSVKGFYGWTVLGRTTLSDQAASRLLSELKKGIPTFSGPVVECFTPRHGLRIEHSGKTVDLVICFECYRCLTYLDGKEDGFSVTRDPQPAFDAELTRAGMELAKKPS